MKKIIFLTLGTIVVQQLLKYFDIKSFEDLKKFSFADLKEFVTPKHFSTN
ncbi:MAG: hypothetical protein V4549_17540 [Bacteroidota bacterium]